MLTERGIGGRLVRVDEPETGMSVLSVTRDLTIWVQGDYVSWKRADGSYQRRPITDLVDVTEEIVCSHEELEPRSVSWI